MDPTVTWRLQLSVSLATLPRKFGPAQAPYSMDRRWDGLRRYEQGKGASSSGNGGGSSGKAPPRRQQRTPWLPPPAPLPPRCGPAPPPPALLPAAGRPPRQLPQLPAAAAVQNLQEPVQLLSILMVINMGCNRCCAHSVWVLHHPSALNFRARTKLSSAMLTEHACI